MIHKKTSIIIALILLFSLAGAVSAQDGNELPVYVVQPGENLTEIAEKFHVPLNDLINANNIPDINLLSAGDRLFIPGLEGISGVLIAEPVAFGDKLQSLLLRNQISMDNFKRLNPVTSPNEVYAGAILVLPAKEEGASLNSNVVLSENDTLLTSAVLTGSNPWHLFIENQQLTSPSLPGESIFYRSEGETSEVSTFSPSISRIEINPLPVVQGHTTAIYIYAKQPGEFSGSINGRPVYFFRDEAQGFYYSLNGISAIAEPGLIPVRIEGVTENGDLFSIEQNILLKSGGYRNETLSVEQTTIEEATVLSENEQINQILESVNPEKYWTKAFRFPVDGSLEDGTIAFSSYFGSRRSYNNGQHYGYHGGLDFSVVLVSFNIYSDAPGRVIFAGTMNIRGNTLFIDHGQGVVSGYAHMSEFKVNAGDFVEEGQLIGLIGKTGRVTGPHLHWDIWVNRTPVDPFDWIDNTYP